eukprot:jgi/Botrbrau1/22514/Bobra.114_2s0039.1
MWTTCRPELAKQHSCLSLSLSKIALLPRIRVEGQSLEIGRYIILNNVYSDACFGIQWSYVAHVLEHHELIGGSRCTCNLLAHDNVNSGSQEYMYSVRSLHETSSRLLSYIRYVCTSSHDGY